MNGKSRIGILFGGRSAEHQVSLMTAKNVVDAVDKNKFDIVLIGIDKQGVWWLCDSSDFLINDSDPKKIELKHTNKQIALLPYPSVQQMLNVTDNTYLEKIDVIFPLVHGPLGEDGTIQGLLKLTTIPFVGASVVGSAIGMDKDVMKRLLQNAGIPIADFMVLADTHTPTYEEIIETIGLPFFIKPANLGSSIGITKVHDKDTFIKGLEKAFSYDKKIILEKTIEGREIELAVLGNDNPETSLAGEIVPSHEYYDYEAKYIDDHGATLQIPVSLPESVLKELQELAIKTFKSLSCEGMARVDFFLTKDNKIFVNEINTIPGFTKISMYPKLWEASGIPYQTLIEKLLMLAIERHTKEKTLNTSR